MVGVCVGEPGVGGDFHQLAEREGRAGKLALLLAVTSRVFSWS